MTTTGRITKSNGGLFSVAIDKDETCPLSGTVVFARGRGALKRRGDLLVGDLVAVEYGENSYTVCENGVIPSPDGTGIVVDKILDRRNSLIRPPMANLDLLLVTFAAASPEPDVETIDKLLCIAEFNSIKPIVVITKRDLDGSAAEKLASVYRLSTYPVFLVDGVTGEGTDALREFVFSLPDWKIAAFAGPSGVGKSTLVNALFPSLHVETGEISRRIERGKNTTRSVELFPVDSSRYLADTPGFTMLDFEHFDFFSLSDLPLTFPEFQPFLGSCRYTKCSHTKEDGCAIRAAIPASVSPSRHRSYCALFDVLKKKPSWK